MTFLKSSVFKLVWNAAMFDQEMLEDAHWGLQMSL